MTTASFSFASFVLAEVAGIVASTMKGPLGWIFIMRRLIAAYPAFEARTRALAELQAALEAPSPAT
jgi:hypothetical protein